MSGDIIPGSVRWSEVLRCVVYETHRDEYKVTSHLVSVEYAEELGSALIRAVAQSQVPAQEPTP